jgi:hypothetical protein
LDFDPFFFLLLFSFWVFFLHLFQCSWFV